MLTPALTREGTPIYAKSNWYFKAVKNHIKSTSTKPGEHNVTKRASLSYLGTLGLGNSYKAFV